MKINLGATTLNADTAVTKEYYEYLAENLKTDAPLRNYYMTAKDKYPELAELLKKLGADLSCPTDIVMYEPYASSNQIVYYADYAIKGNASGEETVDACGVKIEITPYGTPPELEPPCFVLHVQNIWLPWKFTSDMSTVFPKKQSMSDMFLSGVQSLATMRTNKK